MKRIFALLLLLSAVSLFWACSKEDSPTVRGPRIRYEDGTAYYTHEGSTYTMDLQFDKTLTPGTEISLLLEDEEVLGFTTEAAVSRLRLSSPKLEKDKTYSLTVNGKLQRHGARTFLEDTPRPGDIPEPTQPTIPVAPMGEVVTLPTTAATEAPETAEGSLSLENPPTVAVSGEIPALTPVETTDNGILPSVGFTPGQGEDHDLTLNPAPQVSGTDFTLTALVTEFTSIRDAE